MLILYKGTRSGISAHSGFVNGAKALLSLVSRHISKLSKSGQPKHIVFTGHSAGGAVASLLYLKFVLNATNNCEFLYEPKKRTPTYP